MSISHAEAPREIDWEKARAEWLEDLIQLFGDIREWAETEGWEVRTKPYELTEENLGTYSAPFLIIRTPGEPVFVEPVARFVLGAQGRVDLYGYPSLTRAMLLRKRAGSGEKWIIKPELGWPGPLPPVQWCRCGKRRRCGR